MSELPPLPKAPDGVELGLKCPQSVLYMDLNLRGCTSVAFRRIYGIDHAFNYFVYDNQRKCFDLNNDEFIRKLSPELEPDVIAQKYITTTSRNARRLVRTAQIVSSPTRWRSSHLRKDLLEDLNSYWDAYEDHVNTMPLFFSVERFVVNNLIGELEKAGFQTEVDSGLPTFVVPSEPNWFVLEQQNLEVLKARFENLNDDDAVLEAATDHASLFGISYTPYNLGTCPTGYEIAQRIKQHDSDSIPLKPEKNGQSFPEHIERLGGLVRELTFWKQERTDTLSVADHYATPMYKTLSILLELPLNLIYCMTRDEITRAITGESNVEIENLKQRAVKYCLALINGSIDFYQPTEIEDKKEDFVEKCYILKGLPTSPGKVRGRVRLLSVGENNPLLASDEIIVTGMTCPELGAALDTALAYVTDEGGRLCHAAIVSREKKKPCVTGTHKATQVLRDGMLIEVDGDAGTVTVVDEKS